NVPRSLMHGGHWSLGTSASFFPATECSASSFLLPEMPFSLAHAPLSFGLAQTVPCQAESCQGTLADTCRSGNVLISESPNDVCKQSFCFILERKYVRIHRSLHFLAERPAGRRHQPPH